MSWPLSHDFNEAVQNPRLVFADADLKAAETVVGATGLPLPRSGNFADVYQLRGPGGRDWAVKCFTRPVVGLADRYARVSEALGRAELPFTVGFAFLSEGIRVGGAMRPVVKMEWVEGLLLNQVVRENAGKPATLAALGQMWVKLCKRLREAGITHADLQHGNVLLVPGSRPGAYGLKLIDYDGMYVPALANQPSGEVGHSSYQHPARAATRAYSPDVDRFPHLVVATALKGLEVAGPGLWDRYDTGDNLLFTEDDFKKPAESKVMKELWRTGHPAVQSFVGRLAVACGRPIPQTPWLDQLAPEGDPAPLDDETRRAAAAALGVAAPVALPLPPEPMPLPEEPLPLTPAPMPALPLSAAAPAALPLSSAAPSDLAFDPAPARKPRTKTSRALPQPEKPSGRGPLLIVGAVLLAVAGVVGAVVLASGGKPKPDDTTQEEPKQKETKPKEKEDPPPKPKDKDGTGGPVVVPKPKDKTEDPPVKPKDNNLSPLAMRPVGRLQVRESWKHDLGSDVPVAKVAGGSDGRTVVVSGFNKIGTVALDAATGKPLGAAVKTNTATRGVVPLPGGRFAFPQFVAANATPVWEPAAARMVESLKPIAFPERATGLSFISPDGRYLAFGASPPPNSPPDTAAPFKLKELESDRVVLELDWVRGSVLFTADASRVLVAEGTGRCRWFKLPSGDPDGAWEVRRKNPGWVGACAVSDDGSVVLYEAPLIDRPEVFHFLDGRDGRVVRSFAGPYHPHRSNPLSADGRLAAFARRDGGGARGRTIDLVETATGTVVAQVPAPPETEFLAHALLPDDRAVVAVVVPSAVKPPEMGRPPDVVQTAVRFDLYPEGAPVPKDPPAVVPKSAAPPEPVALKARWEVPTEALRTVSVIHADPVSNLVVVHSPAARTLGAFDLKTGAAFGVPATLKGTTADVFPLDRGRLGTFARKDDEVVVWHLKTGSVSARVPVPELPKDDDAPTVRAFLAPNAKYVAAGRTGAKGDSADGPFRVFDATGKKTLVSTDWTGGTAHFTADGSRVLVAEWSGRFRWFKLPSGELDTAWEFPAGAAGRRHEVHDVSADGSSVAYTGPGPAGRNAQAPFVLDGRTGRVLREFKDDSFASPVYLSDDGRRAAVMRAFAPDGGSTFAVVDVPTGTTVGLAKVASGPSIPTFGLSRDGRLLFVHDYGEKRLSAFEVPEAKPVAADEPGGLKTRWTAPVTTIQTIPRFHADPALNLLVLAAPPLGGYAAYDYKTGATKVFPEGVARGVAGFYPLDRGQLGVLLKGDDTEIHLWDLKGGKPLARRVAVPEVPTKMADPPPVRAVLAPNGRYLAVGRSGDRPGSVSDAPLRVFDGKKELLSTDWKNGGAVFFTADSARVLVFERPGRFRWFKLPSGEADGGFDLGEPQVGRRHDVHGISADGSAVAYTGPAAKGRDGQAPAVLDGKTGKPLQVFKDGVYFSDVSLAADGRRAAVMLNGAAPGTTLLGVFDVTTGEELGRAKVATGAMIPPFALAADGKALLVHDRVGKTLHVFDVPDAKKP